MKETPAPYCHGEPMQPMYRYIENDVTYRIWACMFCWDTSTLPLYRGENE